MQLETRGRGEGSTNKQPEAVLDVHNLSKKFCRNLKRAMYYAVKDIAGEVLGGRTGEHRELRRDEFWALRDVSFQLHKGEAVALVGANGAGKTTLLKAISGLIKPDRGSVMVKGRIAPMIALGAGFNPILSGKENIYVNLSILGLNRAEIDERIDDVVAFAEISDAINAPVQSYSSGMAARLGFACAVNSNPDILLIDEVLAVGDIKFRAKCYRKLADLRSKGASFLLVSHSVQSLLSICSRGILLSSGRVISEGRISEILTEYQELLTDKTTSYETKFKPHAESEIYIDRISVNGPIDSIIKYAEPAEIQLDVCSTVELKGLKARLLIRSNSLESDYVVSLDSGRDGFFIDIRRGKNIIKVSLPICCLRAGSYSVKAAIVGEGHYVHDSVESFQLFVRNGTEDVNSTFYQSVLWS
jgi:lipopolysaccharide transport system ATP-binding protein